MNPRPGLILQRKQDDSVVVQNKDNGESLHITIENIASKFLYKNKIYYLVNTEDRINEDPNGDIETDATYTIPFLDKCLVLSHNTEKDSAILVVQDPKAIHANQSAEFQLKLYCNNAKYSVLGEVPVFLGHALILSGSSDGEQVGKFFAIDRFNSLRVKNKNIDVVVCFEDLKGYKSASIRFIAPENHLILREELLSKY